MSRVVKNEEELEQAIKDNVDKIEIEGSLTEKVIRIKATGKIAWAVCFSCFTIVMAIIIKPLLEKEKSKIDEPIVKEIAKSLIGNDYLLDSVTVPILGVTTVACCLTLSIIAGQVGILNKLRSYKLNEKDGKCILIKK